MGINNRKSKAVPQAPSVRPPPPTSKETAPLGLFSKFNTHLYIGAFIRFALIFYGYYQDNNMEVKYTDVDYRVLTDAARHIWEDRSPFERHTYRYTPLFAWMMLPNLLISPLAGKFIFCTFDLIAGYLIYEHVKRSLYSMTGNSHYVETWAMRSAYMWLYNPLVVTISSRGSAESVVITLVLATLFLYQEKVFILTGIALGTAIHFKLYPVIYSLPMYMALHDGSGRGTFDRLLQINGARVRLVVSTLATLGILTAVCYAAYGWTFLEEAYFYHFSRRDTRHNFSVYFYMLYLTVEEDDIGISIITFLPQVILLLAISKQFGEHPRDIPFCLFAQTFIFVAYNKVVTSQYFLWYLSLLPLVFPKLRLTTSENLTVGLLWGFTQASWLLPAYFLEFKGYNTFQFIWIESLAFFAANIGILSKLLRKYRELQAILLQEESRRLKCQ